MQIGDRIKLLRESKGIGQLVLCHVLKIEQSTLANYENNRRTPKADTLVAIADYFHVSLDYLLGRTQEPQPIKTIAAHHEGEWTEEELADIEKFKEFVRMRRADKGSE